MFTYFRVQQGNKTPETGPLKGRCLLSFQNFYNQTNILFLKHLATKHLMGKAPNTTKDLILSDSAGDESRAFSH